MSSEANALSCNKHAQEKAWHLLKKKQLCCYKNDNWHGVVCTVTLCVSPFNSYILNGGNYEPIPFSPAHALSFLE